MNATGRTLCTRRASFSCRIRASCACQVAYRHTHRPVDMQCTRQQTAPKQARQHCRRTSVRIRELKFPVGKQSYLPPTFDAVTLAWLGGVLAHRACHARACVHERLCRMGERSKGFCAMLGLPCRNPLGRLRRRKTDSQRRTSLWYRPCIPRVLPSL